MAAAAILDFKNLDFLAVKRIKFNMHNGAKFRGGRSNHCWDMAIFQFLKMAAAAILILKIWKF